MKKWTFPNLLSFSRLALTPLFVIALLQDKAERALALFVIAGATDAADGIAARWLGQESKLGAVLDPIADKLLLTSAFVMLTIPGLHGGVRIPVWVTVLVIARDVLILAVSLAMFLSLEISSFPPIGLSKLNTAAQIVTVLLVLVSPFFSGLEGVIQACFYVVAALTIATGLFYALRSEKVIEERGR